jgi:hypothetical protein
VASPLAVAPGAILFVAAILIMNAEAMAIFIGWPSLLRYGPKLARIHLAHRVIPAIDTGSTATNRRVLVKRVSAARAFFRSRVTFFRSVQYAGELTWDEAGVDATARWFVGPVLAISGFCLLLAGAGALALHEGNRNGALAGLALALFLVLVTWLQLRSSRGQFQRDWPMVLPLIEGREISLEPRDA